MFNYVSDWKQFPQTDDNQSDIIGGLLFYLYCFKYMSEAFKIK